MAPGSGIPRTDSKRVQFRVGNATARQKEIPRRRCCSRGIGMTSALMAIEPAQISGACCWWCACLEATECRGWMTRDPPSRSGSCEPGGGPPECADRARSGGLPTRIATPLPTQFGCQPNPGYRCSRVLLIELARLRWALGTETCPSTQSGPTGRDWATTERTQGGNALRILADDESASHKSAGGTCRKRVTLAAHGGWHGVRDDTGVGGEI